MQRWDVVYPDPAPAWEEGLRGLMWCCSGLPRWPQQGSLMVG